MTSKTTPRVYLDHNATSPMRPGAVGAMERVLREVVGNPASLHADGRAARAVVERAREEVAAFVGASTKDVVFTSGGSESLAAAIRGVCDRATRSRRRILVGAVEHSAVLEAAELATSHGFEVQRVPCSREGRVPVDGFARALGSDVALAALQWANNETGVLQPVKEVGRACSAASVPFLVDAVQAAGKIDVDTSGLAYDLLALSGHKIGGPQGVGALVVRDGLKLAPLIPVGAQEKRRRAGTPPVVALAGFGAAAAEASANLKQDSAVMLRLRAKLETRLRDLYPDVRFHGQAATRLPNTVNFALPELPGEMLAIALDLVGFSVSTGSACASGAVEPSHVIRAMGYDEAEARRAVRVSLGWSSTADEVDRFLVELPQVVERVRDGLAASA